MRDARLGLFGFWMIMLAACAGMARVPLEVLHYSVDETSNPKNLIVFLRGMTGTHRSFAEQGFIDAVRQRNLPVDMCAPNTHFAYYHARNLEERLKSDIIDPAVANGYTSIWLVGVSLGGLGALFYVKNYPEDVDGVYVIAPFLGYYRIFNEIENAGGLSAWDPGDCSASDWQRELWGWLKHYGQGNTKHPPIYLGYGNTDVYVRAQRLLASTLPTDRVFTDDGSHQFSTFLMLWYRFLDDIPMGY